MHCATAIGLCVEDTAMFGKTLVRWLAAGGRPVALAERAANEPNDQPLEDLKPSFASDNWLTRMIQRHRVLTASGIAVGLFVFGGIAWSARNETRLIRKVTAENKMLEEDTMFDELLNLPSYPPIENQSDTSSATSQFELTNRSGLTLSEADESSSTYNPFEQLPPLDREAASSVSDADTPSPQFTIPEVNDFPALSSPDGPDAEFPTLAFPEFDNEPQLDESADQAEPLLNSSNPFLSE
jgi:hypothetical protein